MRDLRIFISGCSGVGKTTLCKAMSEVLGIYYVNTSASGLWPKYGIQSHTDAIELPPPDALRYQREVHDTRVNELRKYEGPLITDRGVMDQLIYLSDYKINPRDRDVLISEIMADFMQDLVNYNCVFIKVLRPFDWVTEDNGKRIKDEFYQIQSNMKYAGFDFRMFMDKQYLKHYYQMSETGSPLVYLKQIGDRLKEDRPSIMLGGMYTKVLDKRIIGVLQILSNSGILNTDSFNTLYEKVKRNKYDPKKYI